MEKKQFLFLEGVSADEVLQLPILSSALALIWVKPLAATLATQTRRRWWLGFWMGMAVVAWLEAQVFADFLWSHYLVYCVVKALVCVGLTEAPAGLFAARPAAADTEWVQLQKTMDGFDAALFKELLYSATE